MTSSRFFRLLEASAIVLLFFQALRLAMAFITTHAERALVHGEANSLLIVGLVLLILWLVVPWLVPRAGRWTYVGLSVMAILGSLARIVMALPFPTVTFLGAIAVLFFSLAYLVFLYRWSHQTFLSGLIVGLGLDMLLRAYDTYDLTLRPFYTVSVQGIPVSRPWFEVQIGISLLIILIGRIAQRHSDASQQTDHAFLTPVGGAAIGGFLALQVCAFGVPNVIARWSGVPVEALVFWMLLATLLPLSRRVRGMMRNVFETFTVGLRGYVALFGLMLLLVVGSRLPGIVAVGAVVMAQFLAVHLLWWVPSRVDPFEVDRTGLAFSIGMLLVLVLVAGYDFTFFTAPNDASWIEGKSLLVLMIGSAFLAIPRILPESENNWLRPSILPPGLALILLTPLAFAGLLLSTADAPLPPVESTSTLRVATYNINGGYDELGSYQLDRIALTIEAGFPDVLFLQEADSGRPSSMGVDQVSYLARRLGMYSLFVASNKTTQGVAILSRWPIFEQGPVDILGLGGGARGLIQNSVTGRTVYVYSVQFENGDRDARLRQLAALLASLDPDQPTLVGVDMGAATSDPIYTQFLSSGFTDPDPLLGIDRGFTFPTRAPSERRDIIFMRGVAPIDSRHVNSTASDHRLVVVEVGWP